MAEKAKIPEHIAKYEKIKKQAKRIIDTAEAAHSEAYLKAADAVLRDKDGNLDYERLEDEKNQQKFSDVMVQHYIGRANKHFGSKIKPEDKLQLDQLLNAYAGITKTRIDYNVKSRGKNYSIQVHEKMREDLMEAVQRQLNQTVNSQIKEEHVLDFIKYMGIEGIVDASKIRAEDIGQIHNLYESSGSLTPKQIKETYQRMGAPEPVYLKKHKKK